jgi:hypothetical protein
MGELPSAYRARLPIRAIGFWSLPLVVLIGAAVIGYQVWRQSQILPLPAATAIQRIGFGINLGFTSAKWYNLPSTTGNALVDLFRDSVVMPPRQGPNADVFYDPAPYEYSVDVVDKRGKDHCFSFRVYSNEIYVSGPWATDWAIDSLYVFPRTRIPQVKTLVQQLLSTTIAGGQYAYLPGEEDRVHYSRICGLILSKTPPPQKATTPQPRP